MTAHRRHDILGKAWANIEKLLLGSKGSIGRPSADNRLFINAVFWILRTGLRGGICLLILVTEKNTHRRFCRWRNREFGKKYLMLSLSNLILNGSSLTLVIAKFIRMRRALWR